MKERRRSHDETNISRSTQTARDHLEDAQVDPSAVLLIDTWGIGEAGTIDTLLESLSRLSGTEYRRDRLNIGGFSFSVQAPPYARVTEEVAKESQ